MTGFTKGVKCERLTGQRVVATHHAHILAIKQPLVTEIDPLSTLSAGGEVGQHGWKMPHGQIRCFGA